MTCPSFQLNAIFGLPGDPVPGNCGCPSQVACGVPGNGLGSFLPGDNTFPVFAVSAVQAFHAVVIDAGGAIHATNADPQHQNYVVGVAVTAGSTTVPANVCWGGPVTNTLTGTGGWNFTLWSPVYLGTNGQLTQTLPSSGFVQVVGIAISANTIFVLPRGQYSASAPTVRVRTLPYATTVNLDFDTTDIANIVLTGPVTFTASGGYDGQRVTLRVQQDATGNRVWTLDTMFSTSGFLAFTPSLGSGDIDVLTFEYVSSQSKYVLISILPL